jgi:hypothetical protein
MKFTKAIKALTCAGVLASAGFGMHAPSSAQANDFSFGDRSWNGGWEDSTTSTVNSVNDGRDEPTIDLDVKKRAPRATYEVKYEELSLDDTLQVQLAESFQDYLVAWQLGYWSPSRLRKDVRRGLGLSSDTPVYMKVEIKNGVQGYSFSGPGEAMYNNGRWLYADEVAYVQ